MGNGRNSRVTGCGSEIGSHSISDIPRDILVRILLKLSIKRILVCKSVCKSWYALISDPEFAKLHFDQAEVCPLLESSDSLYLVQPEFHDFELELGLCGCCHSMTDAKVKLDSIFKIPSRGRVVNSCNGLLLFANPDAFDDKLIRVCNPITGEFVNLPEGWEKNTNEYYVSCGLGFSSTSNRYKVVRMTRHFGSLSPDMMVEVHVVGTESWKNMGLMTVPVYGSYPTYLNGFLYWSNDMQIVSFDVEKENFQLFFINGVDHLDRFEKLRVREIGQELCVYGSHFSGDFNVWAMKDYCDEKAWANVFSIYMPMIDHGSKLSLIKPMKHGSLLMFYSDKKAFICIDSRKSAARYVKVRGTKSSFMCAIAYIPSFVSLKHALSRQAANVKRFDSVDEDQSLEDVYPEPHPYDREQFNSEDGDQELDCDEDGNYEFDSDYEY